MTSLRHRLKVTRHKVEINCPEDLTLRSIPGLISQIFTNLINNSLIHAFNDDDAGLMKIAIEQVEGNKIKIEFSDNGKGIPEENLSQLFEAYFTTNRDGGGSGLGTHIIHSIVVEKLDGTLDVQSKVGEGTKFTFVIPQEMSMS